MQRGKSKTAQKLRFDALTTCLSYSLMLCDEQVQTYELSRNNTVNVEVFR